jgi:4-carboxymuconolactone decarboxylase
MRLPHFGPDELEPAQRRLYETLTTGQRRTVHDSLDPAIRMTDAEGRLQGPFNAMLVHPGLGDALQEVGRRLRFEGHLPARARELVILVVAASEQSDFEWAAHEAIARSIGIEDDIIATLASEQEPELDAPIEEAATVLARTLVHHGDCDDDTYRRVLAVLGPDGVFEVSTTVGLYQLLAQQMRIFRVPGPPGPWRQR